MSALAAKKLAKEVAELRASPDNKRCFNCETLVSTSSGARVQHTQRDLLMLTGLSRLCRLQGTTYYVPQFSIFVCTQCSGIQ
jgi:hypothetical protein